MTDFRLDTQAVGEDLIDALSRLQDPALFLDGADSDVEPWAWT